MSNNGDESPQFSNIGVLCEAMNCPICLEFATAPIHSCSNGHIVCGRCVKYLKEKRCGLCQDELEKNSALDRVFGTGWVEISCSLGCKKRLNPGEMTNHLLECDFRPIRCVELSGECKKLEYSPNELFKHWKEVHKVGAAYIAKYELDRSGCTVLVKRSFFPKQGLLAKDDNAQWLPQSFEFNGQTFFIHVIIKQGLVHWWVTILGGEQGETGSGYRYNSIMAPKKELISENYFVKGGWGSFPVHSLQHYSIDKAVESGHIHVTYRSVVEALSELKADKYVFCIRVDLHKVTS